MGSVAVYDLEELHTSIEAEGLTIPILNISSRGGKNIMQLYFLYNSSNYFCCIADYLRFL